MGGRATDIPDEIERARGEPRKFMAFPLSLRMRAMVVNFAVEHGVPDRIPARTDRPDPHMYGAEELTVSIILDRYFRIVESGAFDRLLAEADIRGEIERARASEPSLHMCVPLPLQLQAKILKFALAQSIPERVTATHGLHSRQPTYSAEELVVGILLDRYRRMVETHRMARFFEGISVEPSPDDRVDDTHGGDDLHPSRMLLE